MSGSSSGPLSSPRLKSKTRLDQNALRALGVFHPKTLIYMLAHSCFQLVELPHAIRAAALIRPTEKLRGILRMFLNHGSARVREAAVIALGRAMTADLFLLMNRIAAEDPSPNVRAAAQKILDCR